MLQEARHHFDKVAGAMPEIELKAQDLGPGVLASAGRTRHAENICAAGDTRQSARLDRGGSDLLIAQHVHEHGKPVDLFFEQRPHSLGRHIPPGEAGSTRRYDGVYAVVRDPGSHLDTDLIHIVLHDGARGQLMAIGLKHFGKERTGFVFLRRARVGYGQDGDPDRFEGKAFIDAGHGRLHDQDRAPF